MADRLMKELMARSLDDLPPQTRRLLELIAEMVSTGARVFTSAAARCARIQAGAQTQVRHPSATGCRRWNI